VATVTINRPERRNALSWTVMTELRDALAAAKADADVRVVVLTGAGERAFCAGADLREMADGAMEAPPPDFLPIFGRNVEVAKPTIAAVNGVAYAGGFLLTQMCDLVVAAEHARFAITEAKVGRGTPWAAPLPWLLAPRVALELLLTGEHLTAERAREIGLANRVVPVAELRATAQQLAETIAANAPLSVAAAKRTVYLSQPDVYAQADAIWDPVYRSADAQEGPRAFRDGRTPDWQGR
jgi:enoyl-CoA hydratase/carnithine racemase